MGLNPAIDVTAEQRKTLLALLAKHLPNTAAWVYGSRAKWTSRPQSDLDMVVFAPPEQNGRVSDLREAFEESNLPFRVDLFVWDNTPERFRKQIEAEHVVLAENENQSAGAGRPTVTLGKVADIIMGQSPSGDTVSTESSHGIALLNGPTEFGAFHPAPVQFTTAARKYAQPGDLLFCVRGSTTGRMNWADQEYAIGRGIAAIRHRQEPMLQSLIRGAIEVNLPELLNRATGSTFPNVSASQLAEIPYPNLSKFEQRAIARILGTLDDKIELNRRMNETLEAMARALFRSWFVDFDPVRAKMAGRDPALPPAIAALFPDRMVNSELGQIPAGWKIGCLGDLVEQVRDNENPLASPDVLFQHFSIPAFDKDHWPTTERGENIKSQKSRVFPDVILVSKLNPEIDRVWLVDIQAGERAVCSTEFLVLRPRPPYGKALSYCLVRSPAFRQKLRSLVTGTSKSHQRAPADAVLALPIVLFPKPVAKAFETAARTYLHKGQNSRRESRTLVALRDSLLPKLVSGELQAQDVSLPYGERSDG